MMDANEIAMKMLRELSKKENIPIPVVVWLDRKGMDIAEYVDSEILIDDRLKKYYHLQDKTVRVILKYIIPHEFYHYLEDVKKIENTWKQSEFAATDYGKRFAGVSSYTCSVYWKGFKEWLKKEGYK